MCGYSLCRNLNKIDKINDHNCYMLAEDAKAYTEKCICFDYKAEQDTGIHRANLIVAHYFDGTKFYFKTNDEFCEWLISEKYEGYIAIAQMPKDTTRNLS